MNFAELTSSLPAPIARALAARGYETATGVQAAVLEAGHEGRDLLVSSQTGSGKTVAFGAALAQTLLAGETTPRAERGAPLALVVVPTRELAAQVREELAWLLAETRLRLASFTGGTSVSGDLRALQTGVDVAIGTPGRLVDLIRRERLNLGAVRVVVLDEADEMLDLGFREDLTTLLQAAPVERRTLLLSATMPAEIQALAKRFQRDAVRVDVRRDPTTGKTGHDDITYVAHLISGADRLAVVVNVLRAAGDGRAIVFVTTRDSVSRLHAALTARGFAATAISGERAQNERDRALEQLRKGEASVLVATNVAARGLHLPDVDLIVHADLPLNAESLTHRSGRTGRAGRKGTAVVIAGLSERRKAERLLAMAHVQVAWTPPPSAEAITDAARERLVDELVAADVDASEAAAADDAGADGAGAPPDAASVKAAKAAAYRARKRASAEALLQRLESTLDTRALALRLLQRELDRLPVGERVHPVAMPAPGARRDGDRDSGPKPGRADFSRHGVVFRVNIGGKDNADPRWLLPLICRRGSVTNRDVGAIRIGPQWTEFEIAPGAAEDFALSAAETDPRAPHVVISRVGGAPAPARGYAPARSHTSAPHAPAQRRASAPKPTPHAPKPPAEATAPVAVPPVARPTAPPATPKAPVVPPAPVQPPAAAAPAPVASKHAKSPAPQIETKRAPKIEAKRAPFIPASPAKPARIENTSAAGAPPRFPAGNNSRPSWQAAPRVDGSRPPRRLAPPAGPRADRARDDRPRFDRTHDDRPKTDRPRMDRPRVDRPHAERRPREAGPRPDRHPSGGNTPLKRAGTSGGKPTFAPKTPGAPFWKTGARKRPGPA